MSTLRSFVRGVLSDDGPLKGTVRSKPDRLSESFELRRLVDAGSKDRPATDFFEFYWAHQMEGNQLRHIWPLAKLLLFRWPWHVPRALLALWTISWSFTVLAAWIWVRVLRADDASQTSWPVLLAVVSAALGIVQAILARFLGDAARYLSPTPENVGIRHQIRSSGIEVVRRIHSSGKYDRVIIVGHSLGSVIGYDIITYLWDEMNGVHAELDRPVQKVLKALEKLKARMADPSDDVRREFWATQRALWLEQRALGNPWLITDFVTIGSPLTHGALLFAENEQELRQRQADRELPVCPPTADEGKYSYRSPAYFVNKQERNVRTLHHAAPFAVTRWTNIFTPLKYGLLGDWVGGPVRPAFGHGVKDVPLVGAWFANWPLLSHIGYWRPPSTSPGIQAIIRALDLNSRDWLRVGTKEAAGGSPESADVEP